QAFCTCGAALQVPSTHSPATVQSAATLHASGGTCPPVPPAFPGSQECRAALQLYPLAQSAALSQKPASEHLPSRPQQQPPAQSAELAQVQPGGRPASAPQPRSSHW